MKGGSNRREMTGILLCNVLSAVLQRCVSSSAVLVSGGTISGGIMTASTWPCGRFCWAGRCSGSGSRCVCGYVPGMLYHLDLPDVLAFHALVVGGEQDFHCPGPRLRQAFEDLRSRYAAAGAPDVCHLAVGSEGHRFYADLAWPKILKLL